MAQEKTGAAVHLRQLLRLLIVEDSPADAELMVAVLKRAGYPLSFDTVDSPEHFQRRLEQGGYDLIVSDHNLGAWTGIEALEMLRQSGKDIPFLLATATLGDEAAVEYIKQGAADYVLKHRLERLPLAVGRALREKAHREETNRLQETILCAKKEWELTFDSVPDPVFILDEECRVQRANRSAAEALGLEFSQLIGRPCHEVVHGRAEPPPECPHWRLRQTGREERGDIEEPRLGKTFDVTCTPLRDPGGVLRGCVQVMRNITARKRAEEALRQSEGRYRELVENAIYGIYQSSVDGSFLDVNPALVAMLGYESKAELLAANLATDIYHHEGDRERFIGQYRQAGLIEGVEVEWKRKDGTPITVRLSGRTLRDRQGAPEGFEVIAENVTERRTLEEQLRGALKMEAVGRLAGGVAHDFNNLLNVIIGYSAILLERLGPDDPLRSFAEEVRKAGDRAASLTRQLLAFSRRQLLEPRVLDLNVVMADTGQMLRRLIGEQVELVIAPAPELGRVKADPGQIEQVLMNLAVNARDAMLQGGKLTLETANVELDESYTRLHANVPPGPYVMLAVSDTGQGMDAETRSHIFEPFFTTKEKGKGTGLGLATVYGIVKQSGGHIWVYSEAGLGTTFKVYLPRVEDAITPASKAADTTSRGSETILLVEDEVSLRELAHQLLEGQGYSVLAGNNVAEAAEIASRHPGPIHMMLTDVIMPGISGRELAARLARLRPEMKVLYMSGYTDEAIVNHGVLEPGTAFLQKPFTPDDLARKVRAVLDFKN